MADDNSNTITQQTDLSQLRAAENPVVAASGSNDISGKAAGAASRRNNNYNNRSKLEIETSDDEDDVSFESHPSNSGSNNNNNNKSKNNVEDIDITGNKNNSSLTGADNNGGNMNSALSNQGASNGYNTRSKRNNARVSFPDNNNNNNDDANEILRLKCALVAERKKAIAAKQELDYAMSQIGTSPRNGNNNNNGNYGNYGNYNNYDNYGHSEEKLNGSNDYFSINDNGNEGKTSKMVSTIGINGNHNYKNGGRGRGRGRSQSGNANKSRSRSKSKSKTKTSKNNADNRKEGEKSKDGDTDIALTALENMEEVTKNSLNILPNNDDGDDNGSGGSGDNDNTNRNKTNGNKNNTSFKPNNRDNYQFRYGHPSRGFGNHNGYSFHFPHSHSHSHGNSHSNLHSQSSNPSYNNSNNNNNNNTSYTAPTRGSDAYDHGLHRFNPMSMPMPFLEMQNYMMCQTSTEYRDKTLAQVAPAMFRKVLTGHSDINERIFVIQALRKVDVFNRIPAGERNSFYEREIPFRNIDLVHLVIDSCIQYFSEEIRKTFNQDNIDKRDIIRLNDINLQLLEISQEYTRDQGEHTQKSWLHLIIDVINKNVQTGCILSNFQRRKISELEKPGSKKVLLSGGNKNVRNISNYNVNKTKKKKGTNLNNNYKNNKNNNNNNNNNKTPAETETSKYEKIRKIANARNCDLKTAEALYNEYRNKPCWSFNKTGLCRKNLDCWFGHFCKVCGGPHPECNCSL